VRLGRTSPLSIHLYQVQYSRDEANRERKKRDLVGNWVFPRALNAAMKDARASRPFEGVKEDGLACNWLACRHNKGLMLTKLSVDAGVLEALL